MKQFVTTIALSTMTMLSLPSSAQNMPMTTTAPVYRNVFADMGYKPAQIDRKLQDIVHDLFEGPQKIYFEVGDTMAYVSDVKNHDVRTEGMSYGMMAAVQLDRKDMFDRLWRWARRYMQHHDGPMKGYFAWSCKTDGTRNAQGAASDGELYFVTTLLLASNRWGNDTGIDYKAEARHILDEAMSKNGTNDVSSLIDPATHLITFAPGGFGAGFTDPSYHIPAFYEVWAHYADDGRQAFWNDCAQASRAYLHKVVDSVTALTPDYSKYDGSKMEFRLPEGRRPRGFVPMDAFRYDSWRVPMNITLDYVWNGGDATWQRDYARRIRQFFYSKGINTFVDQYNVDGSDVQDTLRAGSYAKGLRHSLGLLGTLASTAVISDDAHAKEFVQAFWKARHVPYKDGYYDAYYDGFLQLFAFLHLSGRYKMIHDKANNMEAYLQMVTPAEAAEGVAPDEDGFVRLWRLADPIRKPNRSNTMFTDSYIRQAFADNQPQLKHRWHVMKSTDYHVKLFRLATGLEVNPYGNVFWVETVIDSPEQLDDVRMAIGSNSASMWWFNGEEAAILSGDRRMVMDDVVSRRLTLKKGRNTVRGAIINGPGMSDFCLRFIDAQGNPVRGVKAQIIK